MGICPRRPGIPGKTWMDVKMGNRFVLPGAILSADTLLLPDKIRLCRILTACTFDNRPLYSP
jgi:hypothetical protein